MHQEIYFDDHHQRPTADWRERAVRHRGVFPRNRPCHRAAAGAGVRHRHLDDVERACTLAQQAFDTYRDTTPEQRAAFLEQIAQNILDLGPVLIERAMQESGLPQARLEGERGRTVGQLRLFAKVVRDGRWLGAALDSALPDRTPPRPDLRLRKIGVGPVVVFGASNFPLAFSVAGGDTASALAAGCPVVVKAHGAHPGTSELVGKAVQAAVASCGLPEGVFSMLHGDGRTIGQALVSHPAIKAVGFTGSRQGGMALVRAAAQRPEPIPVYAEMSSINPMFLLPDALAQGAGKIGSGFVDSLTLGSGQFCTNPGLVIAIEGEALNAVPRRRRDRTARQDRHHHAHARHPLCLQRRRGKARQGIWRDAAGARPERHDRLRRPGCAVPDRRRQLPRQPGAGR